mgnify:CR=1 FL=1
MSDERFILKNARHLAARYMEDILREGDVAVDATMGNGGDTAFLCKLVGKTGHVYAFDVQQEALDRTAARLEEAGMRSRATLILAGHETMRDHVPVSPRVVMFNLGWLPGAEHVVTTKTETTMQAAEAALDLVLPDGFVSICIYPGHEEGARELHALLNWAAGLYVRAYNVLHHDFIAAFDSDSEKRLTFRKLCDKTFTNSNLDAFLQVRRSNSVKFVSFSSFCKKEGGNRKNLWNERKRDKLYLSARRFRAARPGPYTITEAIVE